MPLRRLAHYTVRASNLSVSTAFYADVLGLRPGTRPPFEFAGVWLYVGPEAQPGDQGCVHLIAAEETTGGLQTYLGERTGEKPGRLDHIAFEATDWPSQRVRLEDGSVDYVERCAPLSGLRQVFVTDPDGITVELNYPRPA
jgi:catechol 2,3-dioxygenase-like lactoylglutathione lyase family enzyme